MSGIELRFRFSTELHIRYDMSITVLRICYHMSGTDIGSVAPTGGRVGGGPTLGLSGSGWRWEDDKVRQQI
eukprot:526993-Rhodomonas_salina.1